MNRLRWGAMVLLVPLFAVVCASRAAAGPTYAITNARIVPVSGAVIEKGSVVMRDGVIVAVGANVTIPADAIVIDGTGLQVYPGLIDAYTNFGVPRPPAAGGGAAGGAQQQGPGGAAAQRPFEPDTSNDASRYLTPAPRGFSPEFVVAQDLESGPEKATMLGVGVTTVLAAPRAGFVRGQSAVLDLCDGLPEAMVVATPFAQHISLSGGGGGGGGGGYPGAQIGIIAALRQAIADAQWYAARTAQWESHQHRGIARPPYSPASVALLPVLSKNDATRLPVVFSVARSNDILKALRLAKEYNLRAIIETGGEAWKVADDLKQAGVPVIVSLNFRVTGGGGGGFGGGGQLDPDEQQQREQEAVRNASLLAKAGVPFAFSSSGLTNYSEVITNARRAAEQLGKDKTLEALTIRAAEILGLGASLGSIETGKLANLIVTTGHPLDQGTQLRYVFVDGEQVHFRAPEPQRGPGGGRGPQPGEGNQDQPFASAQGKQEVRQ